MADEGSRIVASGGWCAPSETIYDLAGLIKAEDRFTLPQVSVNKGGIDYKELTAEESAAQEAWRGYVSRMIERLAIQRSNAIDSACLIALENRWDVHVYEPPQPWSVTHTTEADLYRLRCIGIEFTPSKHPVPTIHHHPYDDGFDDDY